jgi:hypothetical protein
MQGERDVAEGEWISLSSMDRRLKAEIGVDGDVVLLGEEKRALETDDDNDDEYDDDAEGVRLVFIGVQLLIFDGSASVSNTKEGIDALSSELMLSSMQARLVGHEFTLATNSLIEDEMSAEYSPFWNDNPMKNDEEYLLSGSPPATTAAKRMAGSMSLGGVSLSVSGWLVPLLRLLVLGVLT